MISKLVHLFKLFRVQHILCQLRHKGNLKQPILQCATAKHWTVKDRYFFDKPKLEPRAYNGLDQGSVPYYTRKKSSRMCTMYYKLIWDKTL